MSDIWSWLVANGLERDLLSACVLVPIMHVMALKPLTRVGKLLRDIRDISNIDDLRKMGDVSKEVRDG